MIRNMLIEDARVFSVEKFLGGVTNQGRGFAAADKWPQCVAKAELNLSPPLHAAWSVSLVKPRRTAT